MTPFSILFPAGAEGDAARVREEPEFFRDINLDQVVASVTARKKDFDLKPLFYSPGCNKQTVVYRQAVMRDLEDRELLKQADAFSRQMLDIERLVTSLLKPSDWSKQGIGYLRMGYFLEAVLNYRWTLERFGSDLKSANLQSAGLQSAREYVADYLSSEALAAVWREAEDVKLAMSHVKWCMLIKNGTIKVLKYEGETDYTRDIVASFERFRQGAVNSYLKKIPEETCAEHVEEGVLGLVANIFPDAFSMLDRFVQKHRSFLDETIVGFSKDLQFYISYLEYIAPLKAAGLPFCYPEVTPEAKNIHSIDGFDIALAAKMIPQGDPIVLNDFHLEEGERVIVVSGPNQGGKTTFARAFGQMHFLASLGCPIPGREACLFLFDNMFTHFEREERVESLNGKLKSELIRIHDILERATASSIVIINEILASTSLNDGVAIGKSLMDIILRKSLICVWVTFLDELASGNAAVVSMVSTVVPENPTLRTFRIVRKPADGLAYAMAIAEKYGLTYRSIRGRIAS
ncbi:MAG: MutS-related protein [Bacillota bacterium]